MNTNDYLARLTRLLNEHKPILLKHLQPGLSREEVLAKLRTDVVPPESLVALYSWHNGTSRESHGATIGELALIPDSIYGFYDIDTMLDCQSGLEEASEFIPLLDWPNGRYLPFLYDGGTSSFSVDLASGAIMFISLESDTPFVEAYSSLDMFLKDLIRAYEEDEPLSFWAKLGL